MRPLRSSRRWVSVKGHRTTYLVFRLPRAGRVLFTVLQVSPVCRQVARFSVAGRAGLNRVPFRVRVHGHPLAPGTYRITARPRGRVAVFQATLVVVRTRAPSPAALARAEASNVCRAAPAFSALDLLSTHIPGSGGARLAAGRPTSSVAGAAKTAAPPAERPLSAGLVAKNVSNPLVIAALGASLLLLGLAALPASAVPGRRLNELVVSYRLELALAGASALTAALVALALR